MKYAFALVVLLTIAGFGSKYLLVDGERLYWLVPKRELKRALPPVGYLLVEDGLTSELELGSGIELVVG